MRLTWKKITTKVERTELLGMVTSALLKFHGHRQWSVSDAADRCLYALKPTAVDDPSRLPAERPAESWSHSAIYRQYIKAMATLVQTWWDYEKGKVCALDVICASIRLEYSL
jgi:hypothetical protein